MVMLLRNPLRPYITGDEAVARHISAILEKAAAGPLEEFERDYLAYGLELLTDIEHGLRGDGPSPERNQPDVDAWRANIAWYTWLKSGTMPDSGEEAGDRAETYRQALASVQNGTRDHPMFDEIKEFFKAYRETITSRHSV